MTDDLLRGDDLIQADNARVAEDSPLFDGDAAQATGQAQAPLVVSRPAVGQTVVLDPSPEQTVVLNFDPASAQVRLEDGNLVLGFDDNGDGTVDSRIVFLDLAAPDAEQASFQIGGATIESGVLVSQALALAGQSEAPLEEVAAGPGAQGGGASAYSDNLGSILDLLVAQGVIPPTALQFRLIELEDEITVLDPAEGEITLNFGTNLDGGEGIANTFEGGFEDWQPTQDGCDPQSFPMQVFITFTPDDNEVLDSFTLSGIPAGATLYVGGTDASNIVDTTGGASPLLTPADLASGIYLLPPADSGDDIPLTVTATISDPDSGETAVISGTATAIIDSVADNPSALFDGQVIEGGEGCSTDGGEGASQQEIESFLGLYGGALDDAANDGDASNGEENATDGAAIKTTLELEEGDQVQMTFNFLDAEGSGPGASFQDFAFVTINGAVFPIGNVGSANASTSAVYLGGGLILSWSQESGYFTLSGTIEEGGVYEFGIGVMNEGDTAVDSALLIDNLTVTRGDEVVFQDDFTSFDNWEILGGGFVAIVGDVHTNEAMPGAPTQGLLIASGPFDASSCGCEIIVSKLTYNEDNGTPVDGDIIAPTVAQQTDGGEGCQDCPDDQQPIFGAGFVAAVTDSDGSESLTKIVISTFAEGDPGGYDPNGLEVALSGVDDSTATNFMVGDQVLVNGGTIDVVATFADGSTGLATATIEIINGQLTMTFAPELRVQSVDLSADSDQPFQVRLPQHSDDDFQLNLEVTATEFVIDGELDTNNNEATHQAVLQVEVKAVADGADLTTPAEPLSFAEDDESDPANHGADSGETGLLIPLASLGAALVDKDGSEAITEIKIHLEGADAGAAFVAADGDPLGATLLIEVAEGVFVSADVDLYGDTLVLSFGEDAAGYDIDLSNLIAVQLPVDDSDDFTVHVAATTTEVRPEGDVACESETTHSSFDVHVGGVAGPAAIGFGSYDNFPGCGEPLVDGNTLTLSVFEDNAGSVDGQDGAGPLLLPVFFTAATQDNDGSEKITKVTLSLEGAAEGTAFVDGSGDPLLDGQVIAGGTVSIMDGKLVITFPGDGVDAIDLSAIGVKLPQDSDDDFSIQIQTTTTEYDDDGTDALVDTYDTAATINVNIDAVADPVTVQIDAVSQSGDEAFAPGEAGSVTVDATFGDATDGSEVHTVSVKVPYGFTVTDLAGGTLDGDTITWTVSGGSFQAVLGIEANDDLTADQKVKWKAKAQAVEQANADAECTTGNNTAVDHAKDKVTLDPALPPEVSVSLQGQPLCIKEDGQGQFQVTATAQGDDFVSQIVVDNLPAGWGVSITGNDGGSFDSLTGVYTTTGNPASVTLTVVLTPPADSDLDVLTEIGADITFTATAEDPDSGDTADADPVVVDVNVDAVADAVSVDITVNDSAADDGNQFGPGETGSVRIQASFGDAADGSEEHTVTIDIPDGFVVGALTGLPAGVTAEVNGEGDVVFTLGANVTALDYTFQVTAPSEGVDDNDIFSFSATALAKETPDDAECDLQDNTADDDTLALMYGEVAGEPAVGLLVRGESGVKEDQQTDVQITADITTAGDTLTQVVVTAPAGWVLNAAVGGDIAGVAGDGTSSLTLTLNPGVTNFSEIIQATPPEDTDVDALFTVTATAVDGLDSTDGSNDFPVTVDAILDDALELGSDGSNSGVEMVGPQTFSLNLDSSPVNPFTGSGDGGADTDGSESTTVTLVLDAALPAGAVLSSTGGTVTQDPSDLSGKTYIISGVNLEAAVDGLQVQVPGGYEGTISGTISTESREANTPEGSVAGSGLEPDETDNVSTDSVAFTVTVTGGDVAPTAALALAGGAAAIKEDSENNVVTFTANSGDATDELTTVVIELPNVATGDLDIAQINSDLGGNGTAVLSQNGATAVITITFNDAADVTSFASSFTLDAPAEDSDVDLAGVKITANAKDMSDASETGQGGETTTITVDAVLDQALELGADGSTGDSESAAAQTIGLGLNSTLGSAGFALSLAGGEDTDTSEGTTVTLVLDAALPAGAVLSSTGGTVTQDLANDPSGKTYIVSGANLEAAVDGLQVQVPGGYEGTISGSLSTESREANTPAGTVVGSGAEPDLLDNVSTDSVAFTVTVTGGEVTPTAALALTGGAAAIKEDSENNVVQFSANSGDATDELTTVVIELPSVAAGDLDIAQITADLGADGTVSVTAPGGLTTITITFNDAADVTSFASSFTLDAPAEDSDVDLSGVKITANAKDMTDASETGEGSKTTTITVDAVLDQALELGADGSTGGSESAAAQTIGLGLNSTLGSAGFALSLAGGEDTDTSEGTTVTLVLDAALPAGAVLSSTGGTVSQDLANDPSGKTYIVSGANLEAAVDGLQVQVPGGYEGTISGSLSTESREANTPAGTIAGSGAEPDLLDNVSTDSVNFTVTVTGGDVTPTAALALAGGAAAIKEDSENNVVTFTANSGDATDELTTVVIELPSVAAGDLDIAQITADLGADGTVSVTAPGGLTTITITFNDAADVTSFASSFTLDAPAEDSDVDLSGVKITANAKDITDASETGSGSQTTTIVVDAVLDQALELGADGSTGGSESAAAQTIGLGLNSTLGSAGFALSLAGGEDTDTSESTTVTLVLDEPLPAGAVLSSAGGTVTQDLLSDPSGKTYIVSGANLEAAVDGLRVQVPGGYEGTISGSLSTESREANTPAGTVAGSGAEPDLLDNVSTDSVAFTVTVTGGDVEPSASIALAGGGDCIKEDSLDNVINFTASSGNATDELTTVVIELPNVPLSAVGGLDFGADAGKVQSSSIVLNGSTAVITVTLNPGVESLSGSFTLDAPVQDSDADLTGIKITANAQDKADNTETGSGNQTIDIHVDAVVDAGASVTTGGFGVSTNGSVVDLDLTLAPQGGNSGNPLGNQHNGGGFDTDGSEAVTSVQVTLSGAPAIASEADANLVYNNAFGGSVDHTPGSLVWTFTGTESQLETLVQSIQIDPRDDYDGTVTVQVGVTTTEAATEAGNPLPEGDGSNGAHGTECDDTDNEVTEDFTFHVETNVEVSLLGQIVINEVGLGVGTSIAKQGGNINPVNTDQNYIEIRNITDNAIGTSEVKSLDIEIVGADGVTVITIDLGTASGGSIGIPAKGFLTIYEDGTWATSTPNGSVQQTGTYSVPGSYTTPGSVWGLGDDTSEQIGVNLAQNGGSVDLLVANGVDKTLFSGGAGGWLSAGTGTANAALLLGAMVDNQTFSGLIGDQDGLLAAIGRSDISIDDTPSADDEVTKVFSRVYASADSGGDHPGDSYPIDTNQEVDWTTNNQPTELAYNNDDLPAPGSDDLNPQDGSDDLNPAQGAGTNDAVAGQTVLSAATDGDTLEGGDGQDFLFGDGDANLLQGGDHNDFLFGDAGDDRLEGGKGADLLVDVDGEDVVVGGSGDDVLIGGEERLDGDVAVADESGDLLVGDNIIEGEVPVFNVVYIMDRSGSMDWAFDGAGNPPEGESRLDYAKQAFLTLNQQIIDAGYAGVVNIKVVPFSSSASDAGSPEYDRADDAALESFINGLSASGGTEYESPLQIAANWLREDVGGGVERHQGSQNFIFFLSDGGDNSGYNPNTGTLGTDLYGLNPAISNLTIEAFGFGQPGASDFSADELGEVETGSTGNGDQVVIVDDVSKIDQIFSGISLSDDNFGEDVILGGTGGDMIFGDTLVVDPDFVGTDFQYAQLLFNDVEGPALRLPLDTIGLDDWIEGGAGNDSIMAQAGDDTVFGQEGDDVIYGGDGNDLLDGGDGDDTLTGGDGADIFVFSNGPGAEVITDFSIAEGDSLDLTALLDGALAGLDGQDLEDYLAISVSGGNTVITYETDGFSGMGGPNDGTITLTGVDLESLAGSTDDGDIINHLLNNNAVIVD